MNNILFFIIYFVILLCSSTVSFADSVKAKGLLIAYWGKNLETDNNNKILYFDFIPENQSISNGYKISLLIEKQDQQSILKTFSTIPSGFYSYREGIAKQPVDITLFNIGKEIICDSEYYHANFSKLTKIKYTHITEIPKGGCIDSYIYDDIYVTKSSDIKGVNLRQKPNSNARIIHVLAKNKLVKKLKTYPNGWYYVVLLNNDGSDSEKGYGYVHKSQIKLVE